MEKIIAADQLKRLGRYDPHQPGCALGWAMSGVALRAAATEVAVEITCDYGDQCPWMGVLLDAAPIARFPLQKGTHWYTVLSGMDAQCAHDVAIVRDTQPIHGDRQMKIDIERVCVNGEVQPDDDPGMVIEFVGDSLTSGEGVVGAAGDAEWRLAYLSAMHTYAQMVCSGLKAEGRWVSLSGWGVHCSWDGQEACRMSAVYDQVCGADARGNAPYDFAVRPADLVVINLGTNDAAPMAKLKGAQRKAYRQTFYRDAQAFLRQIRSHNPSAYILWAYGMCGRPLEKEIHQAVEDMRAAGDAQVDYLRLPVCPADEIGARQHPGRFYHQRAARVIAAHWKSISAANEPACAGGTSTKARKVKPVSRPKLDFSANE